MKTFKLTDQLGLDVDAQPAPGSPVLKYFQQLPSLKFDGLDFSKVGGLTLEKPAIRALSSGVSFKSPVSLGDGDSKLSVAAGAHGSIRIVCDADELPGRGEQAEPLGEARYVCFDIEATSSASFSATAGKLDFGASPSTRMELASYTRVPPNAGTTLLQALQQAVAGFSVPASAGDLADLPAGQIAKVAVSGKLALSGSADLFAAANPLAVANLPAPLPKVSVSAGASVTAGVSCEIAAEYEIVARKLESGAVRLGWYHKRATEVAVTAKASGGLSARLGGDDLFSQVVRAISADAKADLKELESAGVPDAQAADIQGAVKAAASRKLEIAVAAELSASDSHAATFLYEIVPGALTDESRNAVDRALRGDLSGLHSATLPGVSCVRSIWDNARKRGIELDVNLLGILNYRSIATLALDGKVLFEPATGSVVITDRATAERIQSTQVNFGADTQKLRHVLAESFLITAAYHGSRKVVGAPAIRCSHNFFELQNATSRGDMARKLRTGVALGLLSGDEAQLPAGEQDFGRTLFAVSTDYDEDLVSRFFLDSNGAPLAHELYETVGRYAIQFVVQEDEIDSVRRQPAIDDGLWRRMKEIGQPGFAGLFPGVPAPFVGAIAADYSAIQWWADAMHGTAQELAASRQWLARNPGATFEDPEFQQLRQRLTRYLGKVAATTREEFGQPWGLIAMNQLASQRAGAKILITGPRLARDKRRALAAAAGS